MVTVTLQSMYSSSSISLNAHILSTLTSTLPSFNIPSHVWPHISGLQLADPQFMIPRPVDIIIGADYYGQLIQEGLKTYSASAPIAQLTIFGWMLLGPVCHSTSTTQSFHTRVETSTHDLRQLLTKFWEQEEIQPTPASALTPDEQACEDHFMANYSRDNTGRFIVRIPLNSSATTLGESQRVATHCLHRTLGRLKKNSTYGQLYHDFMKEYEELGHMRRVLQNSTATHHQRRAGTSDLSTGMTLAHGVSASGGLRVPEDGSAVQSQPPHPYYLPHHGVLRESSETTKLRVVFNGSSPTTSGVSVNDIQHVGGKVQRDIADVLLWIRQYKLLFATDITKMYRQINIHPDDWDLQRIMWIDGQLKPVPYQLTTITYGTRSAPFLAIRTLLQLVKDEGHRFPLAIEPLVKGRYVDDIFGGAETLDSLIEVSTQVTELCKVGRFPLAKWHSNNNQFMSQIMNNSAEDAHAFEESTAKLLGLTWRPSADVFKFKVNLDNSLSTFTKRIILSETAQLYDPLGFLAPFTLRAKALLQELWLDKRGWDESISFEHNSRWNSIRTELTHVSDISIPRWLLMTNSSRIELHGFSDASQLAMAAVVYLKVINPDNSTDTTLVCAKTKVAPLKRMTIPRLELSAALLLSRLIVHVQQTLELTNHTVFLWTDSSVTLSWIVSSASRWKEFVRNRVSAIQELTSSCTWRFVPGKENPADCASRGLTISQLQTHHLWWKGPKWLIKDQLNWPSQQSIQNSSASTHQEEKPGLFLAVATTQSEYHWEMIYRYSTLIRLLRVTAVLFRVGRLIKQEPTASLNHPLTPQNIEDARVFWIKATQAAFFKTELKQLITGQIPSSHPFARLTAFVDAQGIIRVGGRLSNSPLETSAIHPVILPKESHFTTLVIRDAHLKMLHGGTQVTLSHIRQLYWIIGGRSPVRSHILRCVKCARYRGERAQQLMGQLPSSRVTPSRPFSHTGLDYAGPVTLKTWSGRGAKQTKGWLCIFICFVTSAVHLEAVTSYSTNSFLLAYERFISRRGICGKLHSDCGTNFKGADAELKRLFTQGSKEYSQINSSLTTHGTTWIFNPPGAPHMGGKWEAAVKSVKYHLSRAIGETVLTFEELTTLLSKIEAVLNSRPMEPLTEDPDDISALTPAHFLVGEPLNSLTLPSVLDANSARLDRWQLLQQRLQYFWKLWSTHYLQRQLQLTKWFHPSNEIKEGSLVLITDERFPPSKWPLARVTTLHPGQDQLTRVVTLKTATTTLKRPISKLAILPVKTQDIEIINAVDDGGQNVES